LSARPRSNWRAVARALSWFGALAASDSLGVVLTQPFRTTHATTRAVAPEAPPTLPREFRAAWVSPVASNTGPDWPSRPGLSPDAQRAELIALLDHAKAIGLNAIILHVRVAADALYPSTRVPWSAFLSGKSGVGPSPAYDPLAFAVSEAHARGLQLHAWFNPFRAMLPNFAGKAAASQVTRAHPSWIRHYGTQTWIDPGDSVARASVLADILEVVKRYDIDGVHLDDYFYPYREQHTVITHVGKKRVRVKEDIPFPDATTWKKYGLAEGWTDRAAWRRANIDSFVKALYDGVKKAKPWVLVGISPFGIWKSGTPDGVTGLDAFGEIYADSRRWLEEGWVDYLAPQLYWPLDGDQNRFSVLDAWWAEQNPLGRHVWPGIMTARVVATGANWSPGEIGAQIERIRADATSTSSDPGHIHFRLGALTAHDVSLGLGLHESLYANLALVPSSPWLTTAAPAMPVIEWTAAQTPVATPGDSIPIAWWLVQTQADSGAWTSSLHYAGTKDLDLTTLGNLRGARIAITAIGRAGRSSPTAFIDAEDYR